MIELREILIGHRLSLGGKLTRIAPIFVPGMRFYIHSCMETIVTLTHKQFLRVSHDYQQAARAAHLVYVSDTQAGISRIQKGKGYSYLLGGRVIRDKEILARIKRLAIPPSWSDVWICANEKGHIQATGLDMKGRKQYRYHTLWNSLRNETKFHRLYEFGKALPALRKKMADDLACKELCQDKVLATILSLMERTYIRVGNYEYEKTNGSYGLTTLKNKHVRIDGDRIAFSFKGKKGVHHDISLRNRRLARIVGQCMEIPGKELFQYYDSDGTRRAVDSGMVNDYIRQAAEPDFTAKDFRTWAGSLHALQAFRGMEAAETAADIKHNLAAVLDKVSEKLGNTRTVCKKYYVHPGILKLYEEQQLMKYLDPLSDVTDVLSENTDAHTDLTAEEKILMKILKLSFSA